MLAQNLSMMVSSPSLIHDMFYQELLCFFNGKTKTRGLEVQKIPSEPQAMLQIITLEKISLTSCFEALLIIHTSTLVSRQWGSSETSSGIFQLYVARKDSGRADSKIKHNRIFQPKQLRVRTAPQFRPHQVSHKLVTA